MVFTPEGVTFLIVLADPLLTKRFPLESNTIVSGPEIPVNVLSVKMMSSVEENSKTTPCLSAPTNRLVVCAEAEAEKHATAKPSNKRI